MTEENNKKGGVKTEEGKAVSKYNALKHGLLSQEVLLKGDDKEALVELGTGVMEELKPIGEMETLLVDRIVANTWRLKRLLKVEATSMEWQKQEELQSMHFDTTKEQIDRKSVKEMVANEDTEKLLRYEASIERGIYKALHEFERLQARRNGEHTPLPIPIDVDIQKSE